MSYPRWDAIISVAGADYKWEPMSVTTSDGYILTMMKMWNDSEEMQEKREEFEMEPIFLQHGLAMWGGSFFEFPLPEGSEDLRYTPYILADEGYVVYIGSGRGSIYSQQHETLDATEDAEEFWDFSYQDFDKDVLAELAAMYEDAGDTKGYYFGYSEGTILFLAAMSEQEEAFLQYVNKAVLLAACSIPVVFYMEEQMADDQSMPEWYIRETLGVQNIEGPNWTENLQTICDNASENICTANGWQAGLQPVSQKNFDHYYQMNKTGRFQPFIDDWSIPEKTEVDEWDLTKIKELPISFILGADDVTCSVEQANGLAAQLSTLENSTTIAGVDHTFPLALSGGEEFETLLLAELTEPKSVSEADEDDMGSCDGATNTIASIGSQIMIAFSLTKMLFF